VTKLLKNHPFIIEAFRLERLAAQEGASGKVIAGRKKLQEEYPEFYAEFIEAKRKKETAREMKDKVIKEIQMRERGGFETISYLKNKIEQLKIKNRKKNK